MLWGNKNKKRNNINKVNYATSTHTRLDLDNAEHYVREMDKVMVNQRDSLDGRVAYTLVKTMIFGKCDINDLGITRLSDLDDSVRILKQLNTDNAGLAFKVANSLLLICGELVIEKYIIASSVIMTAITEYLTSVEGKEIVKRSVIKSDGIDFDNLIYNICKKLNVSNSLTSRIIRIFIAVSLDEDDSRILNNDTLNPTNMNLEEVLTIIGEINKHKFLLKDVGILLKAGEFRVINDTNDSIAKMNQILADHFMFGQHPYGLGTQMFSNLNIRKMVRDNIDYTELEVGLKFVWAKMNGDNLFSALEYAKKNEIFNVIKVLSLHDNLFKDIIYVLFLAMKNKFIHLDSIIVDIEEQYPGHKAMILDKVNMISKDKKEVIKGLKSDYGVEAERKELLIGSLFINLNINENIEKIWNSKDADTLFIENKGEILNDYLINGLDERFNRKQVSKNLDIPYNMLNSRKDVINYILTEIPKLLDNSTVITKASSFSNIIYDKPDEINSILMKTAGTYWMDIEDPSEVLREVIVLTMIGMPADTIEERIGGYTKEEILKGYFDIVLRQSKLSLGGIFNILINNEVYIGNVIPINDVKNFFELLTKKMCTCDHDGDKLFIKSIKK